MEERITATNGQTGHRWYKNRGNLTTTSHPSFDEILDEDDFGSAALKVRGFEFVCQFLNVIN